MTAIPHVYGLAMDSLSRGQIDFSNDVFRWMLCTAAYTPNQNAHQFKNSINNEITGGSGYVAGGAIVPGVNLSYSTLAKTLQVNAGNLILNSVTFTLARYIVIYDDSVSPSPGAKPLICYIDLGSDQAPSGQAFEYDFPSGVMLKLAVP